MAPSGTSTPANATKDFAALFVGSFDDQTKKGHAEQLTDAALLRMYDEAQVTTISNTLVGNNCYVPFDVLVCSSDTTFPRNVSFKGGYLFVHSAQPGVAGYSMTLPVDIAITGSTNLQSYELAITYNTAALTLTGVSVGSVGGSWSPSFSADPYNSSNNVRHRG